MEFLLSINLLNTGAATAAMQLAAVRQRVPVKAVCHMNNLFLNLQTLRKPNYGAGSQSRIGGQHEP